MASRTPEGFDVNRLRSEVRAIYDRVARAPESEFHFHLGPDYAARLLGYDEDELAAIPKAASSSFAGVGSPLAIAPLADGMTVLDHACGSGMDLLLAARRVGDSGRAIGVDMTASMVEVARRAADEAGLSHRVEIHEGLMEELPVAGGSVDVVISNGVLNLASDKRRVFSEIARVLKPGGRLQLADVVVAREVASEARERPELWAACIGGALQEHELVELAGAAGLAEARVLERFDCFRGASAENEVARDLRIGAANFTAVRPASGGG